MGTRDAAHSSRPGFQSARRLARTTWVVAVLAGAIVASTLAHGSRAPATASADRVAGLATPATSGAPAAADALARPAAIASAAANAPLMEVARGVDAAIPYADGNEIQLGNGYRFDPLRDGAPVLPAHLTGAALPDGARGAFLVQLDGPIAAGQREQIEASGATVVAYLPRYTYLVRMNEAARAAVQGLSFVRWVGAYQPAYKLSGQPEMNAAGPATLVVLLFPDADLDAERTALAAMGGTVVEATDSGRNKIVRVRIDVARAAAIANRNDVAWVEPWHELTVNNSTAQWVVQTNVTNNRRIWDMGIRGEGQVVHTSDSGIRTTHHQFRDAAVPITGFGDFPTHRKIIAYKAALPGILFGDAAGASYHGTHTAGTVCGDDSPFAADLRDGQALKAKLYFTDAGNTANAISAPGDLNLLFGPPYQGNAGGAARISSNSWGAASNQYDVLAMTVDQFTWDHKDFLVHFSNGNTFTVAQVGTPAVNKNGVGVGATHNGANAITKASFSSEGPTEDGRRKPTVCAPGDGVTPLSGISSANGANDTGYQGLLGTSMSCPAAAGAAALLRQYLMEGWYPTGTKVAADAMQPSAALLKAMEITSTENDMPGHAIPDHAVGWGRIELDNVLHFAGEATRLALVDDQAGLTTGQFVEYRLVVYDTSVPLKVTLCWTDREGNPASLTQLVNDLDLRVTDPNGVAYLGNVMSSGQSVPGGVADNLNVEEGVRTAAPIAGVWTIRVGATNVPFGPQPFAIAITGGVGNVGGLLTLDRHVYGRADVIGVKVDDANATGSVTVSVASTTESTPETLTLSGSGGVFTGTFPTSPLEAANGDGLLSVSHGDAVTVTYVDAAPAATLTAGATIDFDGPVITGVRAEERGETQLVQWTTNVPASTRVHYGTTPALGQSSALEPALVLSHAMLLSGLQPETEYWYDVESTDQGGNTTRDDNGGQHYRFVSGRKGDILVVIGDGSFPGTTQYVDALLERGWVPAVLEGGTIENPPLGDRNAGLRSFTAVWWQVGQEQYPPVPDAARGVLTQYQNGGGRLAVTGHDICWAFTDPASGFHTPDRVAWLENTLHARFLEDPVVWAANQGVAGDPISGPYQAGVPYVPHRTQGGSGDEIELVAGSGTGANVWRNTDATANTIGLRWESGTPLGNPADAVWGGQPSRLLYNAFEWLQIVNAADRTDILDRSLVWLIGNDHPDVAVQSPNGGEVVTGNTVQVTWTETPYGGAAIARRAVYVSADGGASWRLVTANAGASPYALDVSGLVNGATYRVRVDVADDGDPSLNGHDASDADFTIDRPGGDLQGPLVVAGTVRSDPNPIDNREGATLLARISDTGAGGSNVAAAEWSRGAAPAAPGSGIAMSGTFDAPEVDVTAAIAPGAVARGSIRFWVRGRDAEGNWGPAASRVIDVNGDALADVGNVPLRFALEPGAPNPASRTGTTIRYALTRPGPVELAVYGVRGERIRTLIAGPQAPGFGTTVWNLRDDAGRRVPSGVYFYRLQSGNDRATRKVVVLE